ncbi:sucrose nonfermenting 4-like protein [Diospyros lotus]|uniref:sucrose nonfermenting 4-like protein n=1 Tax=Diospyros lotus TaxID=55363 RepID=UPI00224D61FE|nr:sucrose nonfermenting 4-like protein [Diospyros lotus]
MVRAVITWPHGGRRVSLSFCNTGWSDRIEMSLLEGSSMIFQAICDLPPGYHQYKFLVDGLWRFDDQQLYVQDEYGGINNVIFVKTPELISLSLHGEAFTPTMDIDNIRHVQDRASSSGLTYSEPELHLLDNGIEISRRRLCMHLSSHTIYELIPNSSKVFAFDVEVTVKYAFHAMYKQGLAIVPIWDENLQRISGMLTASDLILILIQLHKNLAVLPDEQLEAHTISAWKAGKSQLYGKANGASQLMFQRPLIQADPDESLKDVALRILQNKISMVPVIHSLDGSSPQLLHMACLSGILKYVCRHFRNRLDYVPLLQQPVGIFPLGTWISGGGARDRLLALHSSESLSCALNILIEAQVSSIPIVDDRGFLINVYSKSDITSLLKDDTYARIQLDQTTLSQALELVDGHRYQTCTRSDPLYVVMERLSDPAVRRLIVVEAGTRLVEGIITLSDVFNFIFG